MVITRELLSALCIETARELVRVPKQTDKQHERPASRIIFPSNSPTGGRPDQDQPRSRVSAQEAKQIFCRKVESSDSDLYYAVEAPTQLKYDFRGEPRIDPNGQSARTDVSLFTLLDGAFRREIDVEFKAHNCDEKQIAKDFLKLVWERPSGLFFHVLESAGPRTLRNSGTEKADTPTGIFDKYARALAAAEAQKAPAKDPDAGWFLMFAVCVLHPKQYLLQASLNAEHLIRHGSEFSTYFPAGDVDPAAMPEGWTFIRL